VEVKAKKSFYNRADQEQRKEMKLRACRFVAIGVIPLVIVIFVVVFWFVGLSHCGF
jgi:hypothetical protein